MGRFRAVSEYSPAGDQGQAIDALVAGVERGLKRQVLKGVTGSGKTYTMAKLVERVQLPTLVVAHNKTIAAQLFREFKDFFPDNAVEYFVSYYDYYQPEAYVPGRDLYIEKDAMINDEIDRMRLSATRSLMERQDVLVVATVSCIYGIGSPSDYRDMRLELKVGQTLDLRGLLRDLVSLLYERKDDLLERSHFRVKGDTVEILPSYAQNALRIELYGDEIERLRRVDALTGRVVEELELATIYPAKHFVTPESRLSGAIDAIRAELAARYKEFQAEGKVLEAERIKSRTEYDLEMLEEMGYCSGIENYSRHLSGRKEGERPAVLIDFFPPRFLTIVDESHVTLPQLRGMYEGDRARKLSLVRYGFRLPSALDNRPLYKAEFDGLVDTVLYASATPAADEMSVADQVVEQVIRPTGLVDPVIEVHPTEGQIEDLYQRIRDAIGRGERALVTTLTKKMSEDLAEYLAELGLKVRYLHSEIETIERVELLRDLRAGTYDVLVGINLLREGLDLPEVSLIAILDADKIGFLRSATSLIQTIGRAARNVNGRVVMYADRVSEAMREAMEETNRRRAIQEEHNRQHGITPRTIIKSVQDILLRTAETKRKATETNIDVLRASYNVLIPKQREQLLKALEAEMLELAKDLEFERAAVVRDEIQKVKEGVGTTGEGDPAPAHQGPIGRARRPRRR